MGGRQTKKPPPPVTGPVLQHEEDGGFRLIEVNLDKNGDMDSHSIWSIVFIAAMTLAVVYVLRRCWLNRQKRKLRRAQKRAAAAAANFPAIEGPAPKLPRTEIPMVELN